VAGLIRSDEFPLNHLHFLLQHSRDANWWVKSAQQLLSLSKLCSQGMVRAVYFCDGHAQLCNFSILLSYPFMGCM